MTTEIRETTPHLYHCTRCLEPYAFERAEYGVQCVCGGWLTYDGQVNKGRVKIEYDAPACDDSCIYARLNTCICQCGGRNHGTGRLVHVIKDQGAAPKVLNTTTAAECCRRAEELHAAVTAAWTRIEDRWGEGTREKYQQRVWLERPEWDACQAVSSGIQAALKSKVHATRIKKLEALAA